MAGSRMVRWWLALVVGLPIAALVLVVAADAIPDRFVIEPLHDAIVVGTLDTNSYDIGLTGGRRDEFSECKRMTVGLGAPAGMSLLESAVRSPTLGPCDVAVPRIQGWADGAGLTRAYYYFRYWNGSAVALRPSIALVGLPGTRLLAAAVLAAVTIAFARVLSRSVGRTGAVMLLAPVLLTTDYIDLPGALVHALGMIVTVGGAALLLRYLPGDASPQVYAAAAFASGAAFLFLADLTNPDAAWALAATSAAVVAVGLDRVGSALTRVAAATVGWIAGFAWLWISKWAIASVVIGYDTVRAVISDKAEERLGGEAAGTPNDAVAGVRRGFDEWANEPLMPIVVVGLVVATGVVMWRRRDLARTWHWRLLLGAPALIPIGWHLVLRNHTAVHAWFTYRSVAVALGIVLLAATASLTATGPAPAPLTATAPESPRLRQVSADPGLQKPDTNGGDGGPAG